MKLSVVTTLYFSAGTILEFDARIRKVALPLCSELEIIYVNDGSPDESGEIVLNKIVPFNRGTKYIELTRNFGHHKALMRGISAAQGDLIFLIDSDLEEEPELLLDYLGALENSNVELVEGIASVRNGSFVKRVLGKYAWKMISSLSNGLIVPDLITARIFTKRFQGLLLQHKDKEIFIAGLFSHVGLRRLRIQVNKASLTPTTYSFRARLKLASMGITNYSDIPLRIILWLGFAVFLFTCAGIFAVISAYLLGLISIPGWTSLFLATTCFNSIVLISLGSMGLYLMRIFSEVKNRPLTLDARVVSNE